MNTVHFPISDMKSCILLFLAFFSSAKLNSQDKPQSSPVVVAQDSFVAAGYQVLVKTANEWNPVGTFVFPTVKMLLRYRPDVRGHFGFDEDRMSFFDVVEDVSSSISSVCEGDGKVWVGFDFYEGEGWEGYGGIGFYDPSTNRIGVLRHPALIDYSVKSMLVTDTVIYLQTVGNYELSSSVGNGVVMLNRKTLLARAVVPPGTSTLWDKDDPVNVGALYNRPIPEILSDNQFVDKSVPQYASSVLEYVRTVGLDSFMVETEQYERATRDSARTHARTAVDTVFTLTQQHRYLSVFYGNDLGIEFHLEEEMSMGFVIYDRDYHFFLNAGPYGTDARKDTVIEREEMKFSFAIRLVDFTPQKNKSGFESITLHVRIREIE